MQSRFCLNTATIKRAPLEQQIRSTSSAGFRRIGLWLDDIEDTRSCGTPLDTISDWIQAASLKVEELCFIGGWQEADEDAFPSVIQGAHHICKVSRLLHCDIVVAVPAGNSGSPAGAPVRFRRICQVAAEHGVRIALEFPGTSAGIKDLARAWKLVSEAGCENGGLVLDSFHFSLGGSRLEDLDAATVAKIYLVHLSDAMPVTSEKLRTHHDFRTFPGDGTLKFEPLLERLQTLGYDGAFSLEIWNQRLMADDPMKVALRGFESLVKLEKIWGTLKEGTLLARQSKQD